MGETFYRIKSSGLSVVESKDNKKWKKSSKKFPGALLVVGLFKSNGNLEMLVDKKDSKFLKGLFCSKPMGARINVLPDGRKLSKAYSLFAPGLTIHDEKTNAHWNVIYQNPNGRFAYLYTIEKEKRLRGKKFKKVEEFSRIREKLEEKLLRNIGTDPMALPMLILLWTKIRVGSEMYYKNSHHKGLTTLKKKNVKVKSNNVEFRFIGKDGVPQEKELSFPRKTLDVLKKILNNKKENDFLFVNESGHPLRDTTFEHSFEEYTGEKFYPHIVRSEYATRKAEEFLKKNEHPTKEEAKELCFEIAHELGHKKFSKRNNEWEDSYIVTLHHYVEPHIAERIEKILKKK